MIVEAYSALLLAFLSTERSFFVSDLIIRHNPYELSQETKRVIGSSSSRSIRNSIKDYLPKRNLAILVPVLERFVVRDSLTLICLLGFRVERNLKVFIM